MEETIDQVQQVGSSIFDVVGKVVGSVIDGVKPGVDVAFPILQKAGGEAVKIASPLLSDAGKKAQEAIMQTSGFDMETAAKVRNVALIITYYFNSYHNLTCQISYAIFFMFLSIHFANSHIPNQFLKLLLPQNQFLITFGRVD